MNKEQIMLIQQTHATKKKQKISQRDKKKSLSQLANQTRNDTAQTSTKSVVLFLLLFSERKPIDLPSSHIYYSLKINIEIFIFFMRVRASTQVHTRIISYSYILSIESIRIGLKWQK